jgi:hypothetical protein
MLHTGRPRKGFEDDVPHIGISSWLEALRKAVEIELVMLTRLQLQEKKESCGN